METPDVAPRRVDEGSLAGFRGRFLAPHFLLHLVEKFVRVLIRLGIGVGKSHGIDKLLSSRETYQRFDLVVYVAPAWNILNEREVAKDPAACPVPVRTIRPRPVDKCGPFRDPWKRLEEQKCFAYGKATLCRDCQAGVPDEDRCFWPTQLNEIDGVGLVLVTEQTLSLNPALLTVLLQKTGAKRPLILLDEAQVLERSFEASIERAPLLHFRNVLSDPSLTAYARRAAASWLDEINDLLECDTDGLRDGALELRPSFLRHAFEVQAAGLKLLGPEFKYVAYDLVALRWSPANERWKDTDGRIRFTSRPYLNRHLMIFTAGMTAGFVGHRLGCGSIASPFEHTFVRHSKTRVLNIRSSIGADRNFRRDPRKVLDAFAAIVLRNIAAGRTTVLVTRRDSKARCAGILAKRLLGWGVHARFVHDPKDPLPGTPTPTVVPIVHYGVRGVNAFQEYESAYCVSSFYVPTGELNRQVHELEPEEFRTEITVVNGPGRLRRAQPLKGKASDAGLAEIANLYLRKLEVDPAVQAAGRIRFLTRPREVVFFAMHDLSREVGAVEEFFTLGGILAALDVPRPSTIDRWVQEIRARKLMADGLTAEQAAEVLGVSRRTVFNRIGDSVSANLPLYKFVYGQICTHAIRDRVPHDSIGHEGVGA